MLRHVADGIPVSIEVPMQDRHRGLPPVERARVLREATMALLHEIARVPLRDLARVGKRT